MIRAFALAFTLLAAVPARGDDADTILMDWSTAEDTRVALRAALVPLLLVPPGDSGLLLGGHQGTATAVMGPEGRRLVTAASLLAGHTRPWLVLEDGRRLPVRVVRSDRAVAVLALDTWPAEIRPLPLARPEALVVGAGMLIVSNVWAFGHEVLSRVELIEAMDDPILGPVWLTDAVAPDGTPVLTAGGSLAAIPFLRYGDRRTLAAGAGRIGELLQWRGRAVAAEARQPRRP